MQGPDRRDQPPLTKSEMEAFRKNNPRDALALVALAAWVNVRPDQLPAEMRAHTCPDTMASWDRVAKAILRHYQETQE